MIVRSGGREEEMGERERDEVNCEKLLDDQLDSTGMVIGISLNTSFDVD